MSAADCRAQRCGHYTLGQSLDVVMVVEPGWQLADGTFEWDLDHPPTRIPQSAGRAEHTSNRLGHGDGRDLVEDGPWLIEVRTDLCDAPWPATRYRWEDLP